MLPNPLIPGFSPDPSVVAADGGRRYPPGEPVALGRGTSGSSAATRHLTEQRQDTRPS